jgi:hypothetical protein
MKVTENLQTPGVSANSGIYSYYEKKAIFRKQIHFSESYVLFGILLYDKKKLEIRPFSPKCETTLSELAQYMCATVIQQLTAPSSSSARRRKNRHAAGSENVNIISETVNCLRLSV